MRLSLATRIFLGYAVVLVTFGAVSIFSVAELHRNQGEIRLVSQGYLQLSQHTAAIDTFHKNRQKDTDRLVEERNGDARRALIRLARLYFPPLMSQHLAAARERVAQMATDAPASERRFLAELEERLVGLEGRLDAYTRAASALFDALEAAAPDSARVDLHLGELKQLEGSIGSDIRYLQASIDNRIRGRVDEAERRERRTGLAILVLSVLAVIVGLAAAALSARSLRPVATLIEGVSRIGRGDYSAKLGVSGDDEIAVLAREFDQMARSLKQRAEQLVEKQEALLRAEQLAAVGRISAQITHEVRNPLSSIGLNVELLEEAFGRAQFRTEVERAEARDILAAVNREVDRLAEITEHYLRMARLPQPSLEREDVTEVLANVLDFSREELERAQVQVERRIDPGTPAALADEHQLRQVFLNIVRNSREAMSGGGKLVVEARAVDGTVEVSFSDTGRGIPSDLQDRIFEPFFSTKENGTGLGLAVSRQILQAHRGSIACQSNPGGGTTFVIRLPRA